MSVMNCRVCGTVMPDGAMFCGECGSSVAATRVLHNAVADRRASDTTIVQPLPPSAVRSPIISIPVTEPDLTGLADHAEDDDLSDRSIRQEPDKSPFAPMAEAERSELRETVAESEPAAENLSVDDSATVFTLTMSTGGSAQLAGSGLLGRRPEAQPGETFDALVVFNDPDRSVSKTHLQFGLEGTELWISDRYSANGTVIRPAGGVARLCDPGRRYRVGRGTRVEIGEQYFDVS